MTETFAEEVRRRRFALDLSQSQVGRIAGVSRGTIRNIETGERDANGRTEHKIRTALERAEAGDITAPASISQNAEEELREQIASEIEALLYHYPESVFPEKGPGSDARSVLAMRHAYRMAARIARGEDR